MKNITTSYKLDITAGIYMVHGLSNNWCFNLDSCAVIHIWALQSWPQRRKPLMVFERRRSAAARLTLFCPGLSAAAFSESDGQYIPAPILWLASELIRNWTCRKGPEMCSTPPTLNERSGGGRSQGQRLGWPLISRHVWTRPHTKLRPGEAH